MRFPRRWYGWLVVLGLAAGAQAQEGRVVIDRGSSTIVLEPYAPNILRVTLSLLKEPALAPPGYGFTASPSATGWTQQHTDQGDTYRSDQMSVTVAANKPAASRHCSQRWISRATSMGPHPGQTSAFDSSRRQDGCSTMEGWAMAEPNHKDGTAGVLNDKRPSDPAFYQVGATFASPRRRALLRPGAEPGRLPRSSWTYRGVLE